MSFDLNFYRVNLIVKQNLVCSQRAHKTDIVGKGNKRNRAIWCHIEMQRWQKKDRVKDALREGLVERFPEGSKVWVHVFFRVNCILLNAYQRRKFHCDINMEARSHKIAGSHLGTRS